MIQRGDDLTLSLPEDVRRFVEQQAAQAGFSSPEEYVCALLRAAKHQAETTQAVPDADSVAAAIAELDTVRKGNRLNGLTIRELITEGRRP